MSANTENLIQTKEEDAYTFVAKIIHEHLKLNRLSEVDTMRCGADIYLPDIIKLYSPPAPTTSNPRATASLIGKTAEVVYRAFYDAAWQMCLQGLLRPSAAYTENNNRSPGDGYSLTERGFLWFKEDDTTSHVISPNRISRLLNAHSSKFGEGYTERSQQAILSHNGRAWLACCVMCGAAAESILLSLAIAKEKDEAAVVKKYKAQSGRSVIERIIFDGKKDSFKSRFTSGLELLKILA